jgi:predicted transcriptional regulator
MRVNLVNPRDKFSPEYVSRIYRNFDNVLEGRTRNQGSFTLTANVGTTTVNDARFESHQSLVYSPTTANASAEIGAGTIYTSTKNKGSFVLTHANNAQTDRTFDYVIVG